MALPSSRFVNPGDTMVASAAHRVATGTRASSEQRIDASAGGTGVAGRHEWRPAEDHGFGGRGSSGRQSRLPYRPQFDFTPLVHRFALGYVANEPPPGAEPYSLARGRFADMLRGVRVYETNLRILAPANHAYAARGQQLNRLL